eukprot:5812261-Amphidinium_carterae.1
MDDSRKSLALEDGAAQSKDVKIQPKNERAPERGSDALESGVVQSEDGAKIQPKNESVSGRGSEKMSRRQQQQFPRILLSLHEVKRDLGIRDAPEVSGYSRCGARNLISMERGHVAPALQQVVWMRRILGAAAQLVLTTQIEARSAAGVHLSQVGMQNAQTVWTDEMHKYSTSPLLDLPAVLVLKHASRRA